MVRLNKTPLSHEKQEKIDHLLFLVISKSVSDKHVFIEFISSFISPQEKDMLAKRLAILYLLKREMPAFMICSILKVSKATVAKFSLLAKNDSGPLSLILTDLINKRNIIDLLETVLVDPLLQPGTIGINWSLAWKRKIKRVKLRKKGLL